MTQSNEHDSARVTKEIGHECLTLIEEKIKPLDDRLKAIEDRNSFIRGYICRMGYWAMALIVLVLASAACFIWCHPDVFVKSGREFVAVMVTGIGGLTTVVLACIYALVKIEDI